MTLAAGREQIENMLHPTREVNSTRAAAVRPRVSARPGPPNRGPAPARNTVVTLRCRRGGRSAPGGALPLGALHEIAGGGNGAIDGAAAALFAAGIAARTRGKVLWCLTRTRLVAPALAQAGLNSDRVIYLEGGDEKTILACFEEGLRHGGLGAVVGEVARLPMTASRRRSNSPRKGRGRSASRFVAGGGSLMHPIWPADSGHHPLASLGAAVDFTPCSRCRPPALAGGADPLPRWRERGFRIGGAAMPRVISVFLPTLSTDRVRRKAGDTAPPPETPPLVVWAGGRRSPSGRPARRHAREQGPGAGAGAW